MPACLLAYRSSVQVTTSFTPHLMMMGREMVLPIDVVYGQDQESDGFEVLKSIQCDTAKAYDYARERMKLQQARQKRFYDSKCRKKLIRVGQMVMVLVPPASQEHQHRKAKLRMRWNGPFQVIRVIGPLVEVDTGRKRKGIGLLVHKDRLKLFKGLTKAVTSYDASGSDESQ